MKVSRNIRNYFRTAATHCGILSLFVLGFGGSVVAQTGPSAAVKNVVLVSHAIYVSQPKAVAALIEKAAQGAARK